MGARSSGLMGCGCAVIADLRVMVTEGHEANTKKENCIFNS